MPSTATAPAAAPAPRPVAPGVGEWAALLTRDGLDRPALVDGAGALTHAQLDAAVERAAGLLPPAATGRLLVHLPMRRDRASVVAHLAVQRAGHVGLLLDAGAAGGAVAEGWPGALVATGDLDRPFAPASSARPVLHHDLALLLSTSGSTGSPKLVRLSHENLASNAHAIAQGLGLRADDLGAASLPLHYCYGLSVLHSHLVAGASVALAEGPVTDDAFWAQVGPVTTLAAVPHTVELLEAAGRLDDLPASLRLVTQAGGALGVARLERTRAAGRRGGWELAVMYGQTEATARMTILAPGSDAPAGVVGHPVAGSRVRVDHDVPEADGVSGELVFSGPGVMLGYAEEPADLALGAWTTELRTGDLGHVDAAGRVHVTGRRSAVAKILGLRIDLARVEARLAEQGLDACVTSDDERLLVAVSGAARPEDVALAAGECAGLPPHLVDVAVLPVLPRTRGGKVDRAASARAVRAAQAHSAAPAGSTLEDRVLDALGRALGAPARRDRSFADQGGDSYCLVAASLALESLLGPLPRGWHHVPVAELVERAGADPTGATGGARRRGLRSVETTVLVRAVAVLTICASHLGIVRLPGGAHTLLVVAGYHLALFTLAAPQRVTRARRALAASVAVALPASVAAAVGVATGRYGWASVVHLNWLVGRVEWSSRIELWFVEALIACTLLVTGLTCLPGSARLWRADPWRWSLGLTVLALAPRYLLVPEATGPTRGLPATVLWLVLGGVALGAATTLRQRLVTLAVLGAGLTGFFAEPGRGALVAVLVALVALVPRLPVPAVLVPVVGALAGASLYVYLVQFQMFEIVPGRWPALVASVLAGVLLARLADPLVRSLTRPLLAPPAPTRTEPR